MAETRTRDPFFDPEWRRARGLTAPVAAAPVAPVVAAPQSEVDPNSPMGKKMGLVDKSVVQGSGISPMGEMDALKSRFGYSSNAGSEASDVNSQGNVSARNAFLSRPTDVGMQDFVPEDSVGSEFQGGYLDVMNRDNQNRAIEGFNQGIVDRGQEEEQSRQAQIANALKQDVANQKLMAEQEDASRLQKFFDATGIVPSPQAMVEFQKQLGRQKAFDDLVSGLHELSVLKDQALKSAMRGFEGAKDIPPAVIRRVQQIEAEFSANERAIAMASGLQGGVNKPNDMIPRDGSSLQ